MHVEQQAAGGTGRDHLSFNAEQRSPTDAAEHTDTDSEQKILPFTGQGKFLAAARGSAPPRAKCSVPAGTTRAPAT